MKTISFKVYEFNELKDERAKEKARDWYRGIGLDYDSVDDAIRANGYTFTIDGKREG